MRYEDLQGPLTGWTYDEDGTIHTASGYRCTAQIIESALWLLGCWSQDAMRYLIHSDEAAGALRPLHEISDMETPAQASKAVGEKTLAETSEKVAEASTCDQQN